MYSTRTLKTKITISDYYKLSYSDFFNYLLINISKLSRVFKANTLEFLEGFEDMLPLYYMQIEACGRLESLTTQKCVTRLLKVNTLNR